MPRVAYVEKKFQAGALRVIDQANEICAEYAADGYDLTLRQLYYQFVSRGYIANRQTEYKRLGSIVNDARMAGLMDWDFIVDRTRELSDLAHWKNPAEIVDAVARQFRLALWDRQPVRVEVWVEKEALAGVVERVCQRLDVPFFACRGYVSQSEQWASAQRFRDAMIKLDQRIVVLHLGDHDPSGIDMTRDNRERLHTFLMRDLAADVVNRWTKHHPREKLTDDVQATLGVDLQRLIDRIEVRRIALNMDQVEEYDPPPNPAKITDSRFEGYADEYGDESWELDALPPNVLSDLIEANVEDLRDDDLWDTAVAEQAAHRRTLTAVADRWPEIEEMVG